MLRQRFRAGKVARIIFGLGLVFSSLLMAEDKPVAPDSIPGAKTVSAEDVVQLVLDRPGLVIIDSRKKTEYLKAHIEGAVNLLNTRMTLESLQAIAPDKTTDLLFYCNGVRCKRSADAVTKAADWGYQNIFWFRGGWKEWTDKKLPYITDE